MTLRDWVPVRWGEAIGVTSGLIARVEVLQDNSSNACAQVASSHYRRLHGQVLQVKGHSRSNYAQ